MICYCQKPTKRFSPKEYSINTKQIYGILMFMCQSAFPFFFFLKFLIMYSVSLI